MARFKDRPALLLVQVLADGVGIGDGEGEDAVAVPGRAVDRLQHSEDDREVLGVDATLVPAGHHRQDSAHDVLVGLDAGEEEKRVSPSDESVDHPVVLDLQHPEETG
jgi:hypothetical protein